MYVSISEDTATEVIESLEKRVADRNAAIDARWAQIELLNLRNHELQEQVAALRDDNINAKPMRECPMQHFPIGKITLIKYVRNIMNIGLVEAKNAVDAAIAEGRVNV